MDASATIDITACSVAQALTLERDLGVSFTVAQVLVRRGLSDVESARQFLAADEEHPAAAWAAAAGHVVNGVVHAIIGGIAIGIARGAGGSADQSGAMRAIKDNPLGAAALWLVAGALFSLWSTLAH